ncbi:[protein release factor]-glutamine N5-methyltransferase [Nannocystis exedens]|uniref:Release factor glutamine methyltransferase n=1 Tax=Nannocystis exedens TaxID=54 RepID=A0A1I1U4H2_9BACT|nr:peptide chain release factor N(5)-glutamine methyltransferase [Nannocystis exedens]PCC71418.1 protein-(glutamine-N5) methyltransferase, release factor-specific [Nannocystis exedens]SFD65594.1 [protein release factor]-glutamine N5-methyltransferase [Nannocystis exedens]
MSSASPPRPARQQLWTVQEVLQWTVERFERAGFGEARADAQHLVAQALGCSRMQIFLRYDALVDDDQRATLRELIRRRLAREPVAYIAGKRGFHGLGLELAVDRRVLIPRPETEHLVDWLLELLPPPPPPFPLHVLDVGTGSGAIALAVKHARRDVDVVAVDVSPDALAVARENAARLGLQVAFARGDLLRGVPVAAGGFAAVAANLPYIASPELAGLQPEVRDYEPRLALDGGRDGLDLVRRLIDECAAPGVLVPEGRLFLEIGLGQAEATRELLLARGYQAVEIRRDAAGIDRVVSGAAPVG